MHILFAGGGTAGHINPALAVAGYIKEKHREAKISYIGTAKKLEAKLVPEKGYDFYSIEVSGFQRSFTPVNIAKNVKAAVCAVTASVKARKLLKKLKDDIKKALSDSGKDEIELPKQRKTQPSSNGVIVKGIDNCSDIHQLSPPKKSSHTAVSSFCQSSQ